VFIRDRRTRSWPKYRVGRSSQPSSVSGTRLKMRGLEINYWSFCSRSYFQSKSKTGISKKYCSRSVPWGR
jgi:hypothetical protein